MTNETSYREKGRALFLAALMVLSVVAMSAAFAGAAAADDHADKSLDADQLSGDDVWIGQTVEFENLNDPADLMQGDDTIQNLRVNANGTATLDTTDLDDGRYYIDNAGNDTGSFWVNEHEIETEFESSVTAQDSPVHIDYEDVSDVPRDESEDYANVLVTGELDGDSLSDDDLDQIFNDSVEHDDDDTVEIEDLSEDDQIEADFLESEVGDYDFTFDVSDTTASDNASVTVTDDDADYEFVNVEDVDRGDYAEITIGVEQVDSAAVVIHEDSLDFASAVQVSDIEGDEVVLTYNTHSPSDAEAWDVHDDYDAEITGNFSADEDVNVPLPAHNWDLNVGPADNDGLHETNSSVDMDNFNDFDRDRLVVNDHGGFGDTVSSVAPADEDVENLEDFEEYATETDTFAEDDHILMTLEDFGAEGAIDSFDTDELVVEITQEKAGLVEDDVVEYNSSADGGDHNLTVDLVSNDVDEYDGDLVFAVGFDEGADEFNYDDAEHTVTFTVTDENDYVDEDEEYEAELDLEFEERNIDWDAIESLPADSDAAATGTTNVAPGTELDAEADSPSNEGGFVDYTSTYVDDDYTFTAEFDLEGETPGALFDIYVEDAFDNENNDELEDLTLAEGDEEPEEAEGLEWDVDVDPAEPVEGDDVDVTVSAENVGEEMENASYEFYFAGDLLLDGDIELEGEESESWTDTVEDAEAGDYEWELKVDGDVESDGTLTVAEDEPADDDATDDDAADDDAADDGAVDDDAEPADDGEEDGTPGFGVAVAVVALLAAAMLALRRQN